MGATVPSSRTSVQCGSARRGPDSRRESRTLPAALSRHPMDGAIHRNCGPAGLVLAGGGARGAYQAGVLKALSAIRREAGAPPANPFPVIAGTSAGAINAAALACRADRFDDAVTHLVDLWSGIHAEQVYRSDAIGVLRSGARWLSMLTAGWALARLRYVKPRSLLDNAPLADLLREELRLDRLPALMR